MKNNDLNYWEKGALNYLNSIKSGYREAYKEEIDTPSFISLLGNIKKRKILDIGCGNGDLCKIFAQKGAQVIGLDGSKAMIEEAKKNYSEGDYILCDLMNDPIPLNKSSIDIITSKFVLMYISSITLIAEKVNKLLKPGGLFLVDIVHPFRPVIKKLIYTDSNYPNITNYFKEYRGKKYWGGVSYPYYYRPIRKYINDISSSGFNLIKIQEPRIDNRFKKKYKINKKDVYIPIISLHLLFKKVNNKKIK